VNAAAGAAIFVKRMVAPTPMEKDIKRLYPLSVFM